VQANRANDAWPNGELTWVGWREIWKRKALDAFAMHDSSFTFFWGRQSYREIDLQLFRAEWPQGNYASASSAHPHWQIDWTLPDFENSVSGIHFGMAGWNCAERDEEIEHIGEHWHRQFSGEIEDLEIWAIRTFEYSLEQIADFYSPALA